MVLKGECASFISQYGKDILGCRNGLGKDTETK